MLDSTGTKFYILVLVYVILTLIQGCRDVRKKKLLCKLSPKVIDGFGLKLACCWNFLIWSVSYSFGPVIIQDRTSNLGDIAKKFSIVKHSDIYRLISFKPGAVIGIKKRIIWYQCEWLQPPYKVTVIWIKKLQQSFSHKFFQSIWMSFGAMTCWTV